MADTDDQQGSGAYKFNNVQLLTSGSLAAVHAATLTPDFTGYGFPPPCEHRIIGMACVVVKLANDCIDGVEINSFVADSPRERYIGLSKMEYCLPDADDRNSLNGTIATFNGARFLSPVLRYEALRFAKPWKRLLSPFFDLCDWFVFGSTSLTKTMQYCGLPPRPVLDDVSAFYWSTENGKQMIEQHLRLDSAVIACLYLRMAYVSGVISVGIYTEAARLIMRTVSADNPVAVGFLKAANMREFLLLPPKGK